MDADEIFLAMPFGHGDDTGDQTWFDQMDPKSKSVFFGAYETGRRPSHHDSYRDVGQFSQYREMNDGFSSDGRTLVASDYDTSFGGTTETTSFYSPNETMNYWQMGSPVAEDLDSFNIDLISAMTSDFRKSNSIGSARPSPNIRPQLDPEDIEGGESFMLERGGRATGSHLGVSSSSPLDGVQGERFKKLKRSVEKLSEILGASGSTAQEDYDVERPSSRSRPQEHHRHSMRLETRENLQPRHRKGRRYDREPTEGSYRRGEHDISLTNRATLSPRRDDRDMSMNAMGVGAYQDIHQEPHHAPPAFRNLRPREQAYDPGVPTPDPHRLHLPRRPPVPRPADGDYECPWDGCTKRYSRPENCRRHVRTAHEQSSKRDVKCPYCSASRGSGRGQENLNTHLKNVHGIIANGRSTVGRV
ncbi:hypothetical protein TWF281_004384 [Arthrobotrys megalospora]